MNNVTLRSSQVVDGVTVSVSATFCPDNVPFLIQAQEGIEIDAVRQLFSELLSVETVSLLPKLELAVVQCQNIAIEHLVSKVKEANTIANLTCAAQSYTPVRRPTMPTQSEIEITCQVSTDLERMLTEARSLEPEILERLINGVGSASELISLNVDDSFALGTGELRVVLEPTDRFRNLMAAVAL